MHVPARGYSRKMRFALSALLICLVACTPTIAQRGKLIESEDLSAIKIGQTRQPEVQLRLGTPSMTGMFDNNETWYYVSEKTENKSFFRPKIINRQVYILKFDPVGLLTDLKELDQYDGQPVHFAKDITPVTGNDLTVVQQLVGNIGRFNAPAGRPGTAPGE